MGIPVVISENGFGLPVRQDFSEQNTDRQQTFAERQAEQQAKEPAE